MTRYVNPDLLQLAALGIEDDHYLPDGRHLRWTFSPELGFPRSGFRLRRRPSPLPWDSKRQDVNVRRADLFASNITDGVLRDRAGVHVSSDDGLEAGRDDRGVSIGSDTVRVRFTGDGSPTAESTPACWVLLRYRHRKTGSIAASAVFVDDDEVRVQDRGASGRNIGDTLGRLVDTVDIDAIRRIRDADVLPTLTDARLDDRQLERRVENTAVDRETEPTGKTVRRQPRFARSGRAMFDTKTRRPSADDDKKPFRRPKPRTRTQPVVRRPRFSRAPRIDIGSVFDRGRFGGGSDEWVEGTFLLNGSVIDEVRLTGRLAEVGLVEWITVDDYADADGWESVDDFFLPIDGDDESYPSQSRPGRAVAEDRLEHARPRALGPWADDQWPPAPLTAADIDAELSTRYLDGYAELADALETLVETEVRAATPQRSVRYGGDEPMQADAGTSDDLSGSSIDVPLLELLQVASVDPGFARLLGLATTDYEPQRDHVDYMVSADWWTLWLWGVVAPGMRDSVLENFRERLDGAGLALPGLSSDRTRTGRIPSSQVGTVVSVATDVTVAPRQPVASPVGLDGDVASRTGASDVPAVVDISWAATDANLFTDDGHVSFAVRRRHDGVDESIANTDPDSAIALPRLPAADGERNTFTDRSPPLGDVTYRVSGMDIWGRWSDFATTTETVRDTTAPPTPTGLAASLAGAGGPRWDLELSFDWTSGQQALAPDTDRFEIHCKLGKVDREFAGWNGCETVSGVFDPVSVSWSDLSVSSPLSGVSVTVDPTGATGNPAADARITVTIPDLHQPFDADHQARVSATVVAVDRSGNASDPARRTVAERVAPVEPPTETLTLDPQVATWPDAEGYCYVPIEWTSQPSGSRTQVLRAPQARLLAAADESLATFESLDTTARIQRLRDIAATQTNQHAFSPDHEEAYDDGTTRHQVALPAEDRGWTVVTVRHTGPTGTRGPWPSDDDAFAVLRTPPTARPPTPNLTGTSNGSAPGETQLTVDPDRSGMTDTVRLYRTPDRDRVEDIRRMRPLAPQVLGTTDPITVQDSVPPDRWYAYRAVAVGESGLRSSPTAPVWVRADTNRPPSPPRITAIDQPGVGSPDRSVDVEVTGYSLEIALQRRPVGTRRWTRTESTPVADLAPTPVGNGVQSVTVTDRVPAGNADTRYEYRVLVTDRRGATAVSGSEIQP